MNLTQQHQALLACLLLYPAAVIGLVIGARPGNWLYSYCRSSGTLVFRKRLSARYSFAIISALIAIMPTLVLRSWVLGTWTHLSCYALAILIGLLSGPQDVTLYLQDSTYQSNVGLGFFSSVRTGRFQDLAGLSLRHGGSAIFVEVRVTSPKPRLLLLGSFINRDKAVLFINQMAELTSLPVVKLEHEPSD